MPATKQPTAGIISTIVVMAISLAFISLFKLNTVTGWVAYSIQSLIPIQIVIGIMWGAKHPQFAGACNQPAKGILLLLVSLIVGAATGVFFFYTVGGGIAPPTPFLMMFSVILVVSTFMTTIVWGGWPFMKLIPNPLLGGFAVLAESYLVTYIIFRVFFNFGFMKGSPVYVASLDPHGLVNAWTVLTFYVTMTGVMFLMESFGMWPLTKAPALMKQPVLGLVFTGICMGGTWLAMHIAIDIMKMDTVSFMVHGPVAFIFGTIIVLNMVERSLFKHLAQPLQGLLNLAAVVVVGGMLFELYAVLSGSVTGVLKPGPPTYDFELWIASALLGVTFPLLIFHAVFFDLWPLKREVAAELEMSDATQLS